MQEEESSLDDVNVFVKYLPPDINDAGMRNLFAACGEIVSVKVMMDSFTGTSLGYGFVRFGSPEAAQKALLLSGTHVGNKILLCKLSSATMYPQPSTNLYIKPLPRECTEGKLVELFSVFGTILTAKILTNKSTGESKQIGFVNYEIQNSATEALEGMNGYKLDPNLPCLIVKYAESDQQRATRQARTQPQKVRPSPTQDSTNYSAYDVPFTPPTMPPVQYYILPIPFYPHPPIYMYQY